MSANAHCHFCARFEKRGMCAPECIAAGKPVPPPPEPPPCPACASLLAQVAAMRGALALLVDVYRAEISQDGVSYDCDSLRAGDAWRRAITALAPDAGRKLAERTASLERLAVWLDRFEAETRALPLGEEDPVKGQSAYNWRMSFVRAAREALSSTVAPPAASSPASPERVAALEAVAAAAAPLRVIRTRGYTDGEVVVGLEQHVMELAPRALAPVLCAIVDAFTALDKLDGAPAAAPGKDKGGRGT